MATKPKLESKVNSVIGRRFRQCAAVAVVAIACGGVLDEPRTSGESHFLRECEGSCGAGLSCISNVCTRSCIVDQSSCQDLAKAAICTDQSIEPGKVAVCDQPCERRSDCAALGADFACEAGFCRAPALMTGTGGSSGGSTGKGSGGAATGGTNSGGRSAQGGIAGQGGDLSEAGAGLGGSSSSGGTSGVGGSGGSGGSSLPLVVACPPDAQSDSFELIRHRLIGDVLELDIAHGGGCAKHEYTLCYAGFNEPATVHAELKLLHDANGDTCEAYLSANLKFDLRPLGDEYKRLYQRQDDILSTTYGTYVIGTPSCEQRTIAASAQVFDAARWAQVRLPASPSPICTDDSECNWVSTSVSCAPRCGAPIANSRAAEFADSLARIDQATCQDFATSCPMLPIPPCAPPPDLMCTQGECVNP